VTSAFAFRTGCVTNVGLARELNEDSVLVRPDSGLWAVADSMGGYGGGDVASAAVVPALKTLAPSATAAELLAEFETCIVKVNADLRAMARRRTRAILGTTLVALMVHGNHFACVWCGDSRCYLLRGGELRRSRAIIPRSRSSSTAASCARTRPRTGPTERCDPRFGRDR
jgi:serine/threonine protein phosphatase PrpC